LGLDLAVRQSTAIKVKKLFFRDVVKAPVCGTDIPIQEERYDNLIPSAPVLKINPIAKTRRKQRGLSRRLYK
jgi:hypothetical protein